MVRCSNNSFKIGIEEEFFIVSEKTFDAQADVPNNFVTTLREVFRGRYATELQSCQVELKTEPCFSLPMAKEQVAKNRKTLANIASDYGLAILCAGSHPFSRWIEQRHSYSERYKTFAERVRLPLRRLLTCALHVHVEILDPAERIEVFNICRGFVPIFLALSTSSPFWGGVYTGLKSYRPSVFDQLPRTGMPEMIPEYQHFDHIVERIKEVGSIDDGSELWWDIRPSVRYNTIELRLPDACTSIDHSINIAACFVALIYAIRANLNDFQKFKTIPIALINENRWRAQKEGIESRFIDLEGGPSQEFSEVLTCFVETVQKTAGLLDCYEEVEGTFDILSEGTAADFQIRRCKEKITGGDLSVGENYRTPLQDVAKQLVRKTIENLE